MYNLPTSEARNLVRELSGQLTSYWTTQSIFVCVDLRLPDLIASGVNTLDKLEQTIDIPVSRVKILIRAMKSLGMISLSDPIQLTAKGQLLTSDHPWSMLPATYVWCLEHYQTWSQITSAVLSGKEQFSTVYGLPFFTWLQQNPEMAEYYYRAMHIYALTDYIEFPEFIPITEGERVVDVGCGLGSLLRIIQDHYPKAEYIGIDLSLPIQLARREGNEKITFSEVDFFDDDLPKADVFLLSRIIHDWNDSKATEILVNCMKRLKTGGRIIVMERCLNPDLNEDWGALLDLNMLIITGGIERTRREYMNLFHSAGLQLKGENYIDESKITVFTLEREP